MPLMRIRSVEIIFEDDMSTCMDTAILDRSTELLLSDSSDDSTKCVDDLEHLQGDKDENDYSVTLNAEGDLSDDTSASSRGNILSDDNPKNKTLQKQPVDNRSDLTERPNSKSMSANEENTVSLNVSEIADSGHFTEDPCSSHIEIAPIVLYDDALLSNSFDVINIDETSTVLSTYEPSEVCSITDMGKSKLLYEYIESNSDSSDNTAICDDENAEVKILTSIQSAMVSDEEDTVCDSYDLQYDSFVDMGKF
ncbi:unnamed protein product, partial [Iphiclides podalirius]